MKTKSYKSWKLDYDYRKQLKSKACARSMGYIFKGGVINLNDWCQCKKSCGKRWNYEWLIYLKMCYVNQIKTDKKITINQLVKKQNNNFVKYYLMDEKKQLHQVCQYFFCRTYNISPHTILYWLNQSITQPINISPQSTKGKWDRSLEWKNKIDEHWIKKWISKQPIEDSHYTRRLDHKMKKIFKEVTCMEELYDKFNNDTILENQIGAKKTAFKKYFKKTFQKQFGFKKNHLDVCQICSRIKILHQKLIQKGFIKTKK
jgi:hypothetical protein